MVPPNNLGPDLVGKPVNETSYRGMIGSLMYLTVTRPDIQFSIVLCARYQSILKELHLIAVKRILRYRKGTPSISLYYLKCSGFDLKGYSESDYVGCNIDRKSTSATCQILGGKLVYWSAKKQQSVAMSSTEAEYVVAAMFCASILRMKSQLNDYDIHKRWIDYAKGTYVSYYSPKVVKAELAKIVKNLILLDKTPVLKTTFPMAWRILFTFLFKSSVVTIPPLISSSTVPDTQDPKRNIQLAGMGLPSILDEGTRKSQPLPEGTTTNPKDSEGNIQPADNGLPSMVFNEEHQSPPNTNKPELSPAQEIQESNSDSSSPELKKYDNIPPLTERQLTDKLVQATMDSLNKTATDRTNLLKYLNGVTETLKVIQDAVKDDPALNKKSSVKFLQATALRQEEHIALWAKSSTSMAWNLGLKMTAFESSHAQIKSKISSLRQDTLNIKSMMIEIYQAFKGENVTPVVTKEHPSNTEGVTKDLEKQDMDEDKVEKEQVSKEPKHAVPISSVKPTKTPKIGIDQKKVIGAKAGKKFKKAHDAKMQVYKRKHTKKVKRLTELNKKRAEQYMWTMSNRLNPELITYVKIHPNSNPALLTVYRNNDKRDFDVHNPFKFADFGITKLDELDPIIEKKKNSIVKDL
nr:uncharacterized mitochondrial protein AtMg00810-like [Tanacetum cinerariifolium]